VRLEVVPRTFWACGVVVQHVVTIRSWSIDYPSTERSLRLPWRRGRFGGGTALGGEGGATPRGSEGEEQGAIVARCLAIELTDVAVAHRTRVGACQAARDLASAPDRVTPAAGSDRNAPLENPPPPTVGPRSFPSPSPQHCQFTPSQKYYDLHPHTRLPRLAPLSHAQG